MEKTPSVNFTVKLASTVGVMQRELADDVGKLSSLVSTFEVKANYAPRANVVVFIDSSLNILREGVDSMLSVRSKAYNAYTALKSKVDTGKRLFESIKNLKDFPSQFLDLVSNITDDETVNVSESRIQKTQLIPISEPIVRGKALSDIDIAEISQIEFQRLQAEIIASRLVNKIKVIKDIKSMLGGGFNSYEDFGATVNATIERLDYVGYTQDEVSDKVYIIKSFASEQKYKDIIVINITREQPLVRIVYNRYGNLDNYHQIVALNNFKDNDLVIGQVRVFA